MHRRDGEGAVWLEVEHDGWAHQFGLLHQRRLYLDQGGWTNCAPRKRLHPAPHHHEGVRAIAAPYAVRFQLEPGVQGSLARDRRSILLRGHSAGHGGSGPTAPMTAIEPSSPCRRRSDAAFAADRGARLGRTDASAKIRWKLSPAGAGTDPA